MNCSINIHQGAITKMDVGGAILRLMSGIKSLPLSRTLHYVFLE